MSRPTVNLKDPGFSALLAFLLPGLGHFYQRRIFKAVLYAVCILGTFFTGLRIGHGQVVYFQWKSSENRTYAYLCQFWVGLPALPALAQAKLRSRDALERNHVTGSFSSPFEGTLYESDARDGKTIGKVKGTLEITLIPPENPRSAPSWKAKLKNGKLTTADGTIQDLEGVLEHGTLDAEVAPWPDRTFTANIRHNVDQQFDETYKLKGSIPRSLWNSFEAPLQDAQGEAGDLDRAHKELGGQFELGVVYTMIAGLLNILAIFDAYEGPAYENEDEEEQTDKPPAIPPPAT
jgi:hypothetical protein